MPDKIAIVGTGLVGSAWAIVFARAGHRVALYDGTEGQCEAAIARIETNLAALEGHGLIDDPNAARARISISAGLADALEGAAYAQESVFERADVKREVYEQIDGIAGPELIVASSSSGIPASTFTEGLGIGPRCLIAHPINPPYVIPLVEIVPTPWTEEETISHCWALMEAAGMEPVRLTREIDGFIANRLQAALLWEAFRLLEGGYATAKDIDTTISAGLGRRWSFIGPFETIDLNAPGGLADFCARLGDGFYGSSSRASPPSPGRTQSSPRRMRSAAGTCRWRNTATVRRGATGASWASPRTSATQRETSETKPGARPRLRESLNNPTRFRGGEAAKLDDIADRPGAALVTGYGANGRYPRRSASFPASRQRRADYSPASRRSADSRTPAATHALPVLCHAPVAHLGVAEVPLHVQERSTFARTDALRFSAASSATPSPSSRRRPGFIATRHSTPPSRCSGRFSTPW